MSGAEQHAEPEPSETTTTPVGTEEMKSAIEMNSVTQFGNPGDSDPPPEKNQSEDGHLTVPADESNLQSVKSGRRVSFPAATLVIGYAEPPDPWSWKHVNSCSTEQLVNAYKSHCESIGIKPLSRLMTQLQGINEFNTRQETLFLRGERLDHKHIEALEEVLRRVQFRTIDMGGTNLDDEGATSLFEMIEYYESAERLNISFNRSIGPRGWLACSRLIKRTPSLDYLDVRNCVFSDQSLGILGRAIRLGSMLTTLHMENANLSGRPLLILVAALKLNELLRELFLGDNRLMPSDAIQLGNLLKFNHRLQLLDVRNNHLQDVGLSHLSDGLYEQNLDTGLQTLVLWNNQITFQGMQALGRAMETVKNLETLNLGHNNITNEGVLRLKEGLLQNRSLLRIGLQASKISCEGAIALAEFVADTTKLVRIDLRENEIKTAGLMALSLSLKVNNTVTEIDLDKEPKKEAGVKDYADTQKGLMADISTYLQRNKEIAARKEEEKLASTPLAEQIKETIQVSEKHRMSLSLIEETPQVTLESPGVMPAGSLTVEDIEEDENDTIVECSEEDAENILEDGNTKEVLLKDPLGVINDDGGNMNVKESENNADVSEEDAEVMAISQAIPSISVQQCQSVPTVTHIERTDTSPSYSPTSSPLPSPGTSPSKKRVFTINRVVETSQAVTVAISGQSRLDTTGFNQSTQVQEYSSHKTIKESTEIISQHIPGNIDAIVSRNDKMNSDDKEAQAGSGAEDLSDNYQGGTLKDFVSGVINKAIDTVQNDSAQVDKVDQLTESGHNTGASNNQCDDNTVQFEEGGALGDGDSVKYSSGETSPENNSNETVLEAVDSEKDNLDVLSESKPQLLGVDKVNTGCDDSSQENETSGIQGDSNQGDSNHSDVTNEHKTNPDFHTNLTFNGMTLELAKVLESLDGQGAKAVQQTDDADTTSSPDDFEKELEMLAGIQQGGVDVSANNGTATASE